MTKIMQFIIIIIIIIIIYFKAQTLPPQNFGSGSVPALGYGIHYDQHPIF